MSGIVLREGLTWQTLPVVEVHTVIDQAVILRQLADMRQQWQEATSGHMEKVTVNLTMLFDDLEAMVNGGGPVKQLPENDQDGEYSESDEQYQEAKARINGMHFTPQEEDYIFSDWPFFGEHLAWLMVARREEIQSWLDANNS